MNNKVEISGLLEFRHKLSDHFAKAREGATLEITEYGKDRKPRAVYELKKVKDFTNE